MFHVPICSKCKKPIEESRSTQRYCKSCHAEWQKKYRPKHSELSDEQRKKANTRAYTKEYVKRGIIKKQLCSICGESNVEMHHDDYSNPLEVKWFCRKHHMEYHKQFMPKKSKPRKSKISNG